MSGEGMKTVFALETIDAGTFVVAEGTYGEFSAAEADRLIACGAAVDPDQVVKAPAAESAAIPIDVEAAIAAATGALAASHDEAIAMKDAMIVVKDEEIAALTAKVAELEQAAASAKKK